MFIKLDIDLKILQEFIIIHETHKADNFPVMAEVDA
jgi:hypothetical protein